MSGGGAGSLYNSPRHNVLQYTLGRCMCLCVCERERELVFMCQTLEFAAFLFCSLSPARRSFPIANTYLYDRRERMHTTGQSAARQSDCNYLQFRCNFRADKCLSLSLSLSLSDPNTLYLSPTRNLARKTDLFFKDF